MIGNSLFWPNFWPRQFHGMHKLSDLTDLVVLPKNFENILNDSERTMLLCQSAKTVSWDLFFIHPWFNFCQNFHFLPNFNFTN